MIVLDSIYKHAMDTTQGFNCISVESVMRYPQLLKVVRLALNMSVHEFEHKFGMYQQSRFERGIAKPRRSTTERFIKIFEEYKNKCSWDLEQLKIRDKSFRERLKAGALVGHKTLFTIDDERTQRLATSGARSGGMKTVLLYGREHMAELATKIRRGREANCGYRSAAERLVAVALRDLNVSARYECRIGQWVPDFVIDKTIIEVLCTDTLEYWQKQEIRLKELSANYKIIAVTHKPNKVPKIPHVDVVKFSRSLPVLKCRLREALSRNENPRVAIAASWS